MYSLSNYGDMITDAARVAANSEALRRTVRPGSVVVEIGTGPGVFAVLACQFGASRVYAIEPGPIIQVAREIAAANHCADRIEFIEDISTRVTLPARADVILSDMRGVLPVSASNISSIFDARQRFLAPGGVLIPKKDTIWIAVAEAPERYARFVECWGKNAFGQDLSPARRLAVNEIQKARLSSDQLLTKPQRWCEIDYASVKDGDFRSTLNWTTERAGTGHGLVAWFDTELVDGVGFSNVPGKSDSIYGAIFFPWPNPVNLVADQSVCADVEAKQAGDDYVWRWTTQIAPINRPGTGAHFQQSQLGGAVLSAATLHKSASDYVPELSEQGLIRRRALELMDGRTSLEDIARGLASEFPTSFVRWQRALSYAAGIAKDNSR